MSAWRHQNIKYRLAGHLDQNCPVRDKMWVAKNNEMKDPGAVGTKCGIRGAHPKRIVSIPHRVPLARIVFVSVFLSTDNSCPGTMEYN
jgi:hypothetical protein